MIRLFIEEIDGETVIRLSDAQVAELGARVGDVLIVDRKAIIVKSSTAKSEHRIAVGMALIEKHIGAFEALAKT